ncbi:MAG TPA: hypothetical protein VJI13_04580 [Candidatus Norongarragalinales archaeon]|nr:hypothetical protein [Candidatus Norongarragalinales archaeon]
MGKIIVLLLLSLLLFGCLRNGDQKAAGTPTPSQLDGENSGAIASKSEFDGFTVPYFDSMDTDRKIFSRYYDFPLLNGKDKYFAMINFIPKSIAKSSARIFVSGETKTLDEDPILLTYIRVRTKTRVVVQIPIEGEVKEKPVSIILVVEHDLESDQEEMIVNFLNGLRDVPLEYEKAKEVQELITRELNEKGVSGESLNGLREKLGLEGVKAPEAVLLIMRHPAEEVAEELSNAEFCADGKLRPGLLAKFEGADSPYFQFIESGCAVAFPAQPLPLPEKPFYESMLVVKEYRGAEKEYRILIHASIPDWDIE